MGIPRFYRWLSERYPLINENITADQVPEFDNLYLDMNGIIHTSSHNNTGGLCVKDEEEVFVAVFKYVVRLFSIIRPRRVLYMAIDGCAPRAKMNQQRSRRFRAADDAREAREKAQEMGDAVAGEPFDSNCITPGTEFMQRLVASLRYFVQAKIEEDPLWQDVTVILSGPDVPGEGEHKLMDYIRTAKAQPDADPNVRHCLYGLDADLIMLALATHEPHFALLREEVVFGRRMLESVEDRMLVSKDKFQLLHISLLRDYLSLEFTPLQTQATATCRRDHRLTEVEAGETYECDVCGSDIFTGEQLFDCRVCDYSLCQKCHALALSKAPVFEFSLERLIDDIILLCVLVGNDFLPPLPFAEIGEGGLEDCFATYKEHLLDGSSQSPWLTGDCGEIRFDQLARFLRRYASLEEARLRRAVEEEGFLLGSRKTLGPGASPGGVPEPSAGVLLQPLVLPSNKDEARAHYYEMKFGLNIDSSDSAGARDRESLLRAYLEGMQWVMYYYYRGPDRASWSWYYRYYHAPMAADLARYDRLAQPGIRFDVGSPFKPFQQLMAVLPANSKRLLPQCYHYLFDSPESPIAHFYPQRFELDIDGVKVPWGGVSLIPWIDPAALLGAMAEAEARGPPLTEGERQRNEFGAARQHRYDPGTSLELHSPAPRRFRSLQECHVACSDFHHLALPAGVAHFPNVVPPGCAPSTPGFPSLPLHPMTCAIDTGVKVFQFEARGSSLIIHLHPRCPLVPREDVFFQLMSAKAVQIDYPVVRLGKVVAVYTASRRYYPDGRTAPSNPRDHERYVEELARECRQRGLVLDFDEWASPDDAAAWQASQWHFGVRRELQQPMVQVRAVEDSYMDDEGRLQYRFKSTNEWRLLHLVRAEEAPDSHGPCTLSERFPFGASVICTASDSEVFGQVGTVKRSGDDPDSVEACFKRGLPRQAEEELQSIINQVTEEQHTSIKWCALADVAKQVGLDVEVTQQIFGTLMARTCDNVQEDIGMNLMLEVRYEGTPLCVPCYSMKSATAWSFSNLAVEALREYSLKYPELFDMLSRRRHNKQREWGREKALELRYAFPNSKDADYTMQQLVKYCRGCDWKKLRLCPGRHMALAPAGIARVIQAVDKACQEHAGCSAQQELVRGSQHLRRVEDAAVQTPAAPGAVRVGHRGVCVKPRGLVPCGVRGTVIGVYDQGEAQLLELVLDEDNFGASDLHGRAPHMRGVLIPAASFMAAPHSGVASDGRPRAAGRGAGAPPERPGQMQWQDHAKAAPPSEAPQVDPGEAMFKALLQPEGKVADPHTQRGGPGGGAEGSRRGGGRARGHNKIGARAPSSVSTPAASEADWARAPEALQAAPSSARRPTEADWDRAFRELRPTVRG